MADYTSNPKYQAAFKKAQDLLVQLKGYEGYGNGLETQLEVVAKKSGENSKEFKDLQAKYLKVKAEQAAAQKVVDDIKAKATQAETSAANAKKAKKAKEETASKVSDIQAELDVARRRGDTAKVDELQGKIDALNTAAEPAAGEGKKAEAGKPEDFAGLLNTATEFIKKMSGADRKLLAQSLNDSLGLNLAVSELVDPGSLLTAYKGAIAAAQARYKQFGDILSVDEFLKQKKLENGAVKAGGGTPAANAWASISSESQATDYINQVFQSELNRDATKSEIKSLYKELTKAQAANPSRQKVINGVTQTIAGLDVNQWLKDKARALPEYAKKKEEKTGGTREDLVKTLNANGLPVSEEQLNDWVKQIDNGTDVETIKRGIRSVAAIGQPESIKKLISEGNDLEFVYAPYKRLMASELEIPIDSIKLDDPSLRQAIGPDKEMTTYDFQKALRHDQRWQYTDNARSEASDIATKVLKDFGFMG